MNLNSVLRSDAEAKVEVKPSGMEDIEKSIEEFDPGSA